MKAQLAMWRVLCISSCSPPRDNAVGQSARRKVQVAPAFPQVRLAVRVRTRSGSQRGELARLERPLDVLVELVLARVAVGPQQLPRAQPAQLENLQHVDQVGAGGKRDEEA